MACLENAKGYSIPSAAISPGTSVTISPDDAEYSMITVFNEATKGVKVEYETEDGGGESFLVPKGFVHTRKMKSNLIYNSVKCISVDPSISATGTISFNFGN